MLSENEKLVSWDVIVLTTAGRKLHCCTDLGIDFSDSITKPIDETLEAIYPCEWVELD